MAEEYFELLGIPIEPIKAEPLRLAYQEVRLTWFMRQFEPEYLLEAKPKLEQIDDAYRILKDPRRQALLLRQVRSKQKVSAAESGEIALSSRDATAPTSTAKVVHRPRLARQLVLEAEGMVHRRQSELGPEDRKSLIRLAFDSGLSYHEAAELTDRVIRQVELLIKPLSKQPRGPAETLT